MNGLPQNDQVLENIFSALRWFFLVVSAWIYMAYYESESTVLCFWVLIAFGTLYMGAAQWVLMKAEMNTRIYVTLTRVGVVFDIAAVVGLMMITGGAESPMFAINYLIILHASVYWGLRGGIGSAAVLALSYTGVLLLGPFQVQSVPYYVMNYFFLAIVGTMGGMIVSRERKHLNEKTIAQNIAKTDYLTGLYNHRTFQETLKELVDTNTKFTLVMADIDYFKRINDMFGHLSGDRVLKEIATHLEQMLPAGKGTAFRYGGEEFAVLVRDLPITQVKMMLHQLRSELQECVFSYCDSDMRVTMSFGVAEFCGQSAAGLVRQADEALYEAKRLGRNQVVLAG
ncbi:GGDEF domain-containing protein [Paenibacillus gansuensis]|uniref:GGDEF domain-containing protein n=1 Tax=Paenibacillus gansuensis TaxID=306542 RepID=A0ABW5PA09_9BACL